MGLNKIADAKLQKYNCLKKDLLENGLWINFNSPYGLEHRSHSIKKTLESGNFLSALLVTEAEISRALLQEVCLQYFIGIHSQVTRAIYNPNTDKDQTLKNIKKLIEQNVFTDEQVESYLEIAAGFCGRYANQVKPS